MGWFSKKKEEKSNPEEESLLPNLPETGEALESPSQEFPELPELPEVEFEELPSLPITDDAKGIYQKEIKTAIAPINEPHKFENSPEESYDYYQKKTKEAMINNNYESENEFRDKLGMRKSILGEETPHRIIKKISPEIKSKHRTAPESFKTSAKELNPVYIRLDKFNKTIEIFDEIKEKVIEIEKLLKKTREIKMKEEEELEEWEKEIQVIKLRLDSIDKELFEKFD